MPTRYPWSLLPRLALAIELGRAASAPAPAHGQLDALLRIVVATSGLDLPLRRLRSAKLLNVCLCGICAYLHDSMDQLMAGVRRNTRSRMETVVLKIRHELQTPPGHGLLALGTRPPARGERVPLVPRLCPDHRQPLP